MYYESHFGLSEPPFSISPDPRYLYLTQGHREALAHLLYGVSGSGGFVLLTGEIGSGKTTVCRCLLQQLPEDVDVALVLNSKLGTLEFLEAVCDELGVGIYGDKEISLKLLTDKLYDYLLRSHGQARNTVLIIDEAQNLAPEVIEHLRLLTNLETDEKKLLQIILIGQPELRTLIASPALTQMAQRVTARFHLDLLSKSDAGAYVEHRLKVAGCERPLFDLSAIRYIWKKSGGVPRLMNAICDRALLGASIAKKQQVSLKIAKRAAAEVLGGEVKGVRSGRNSAFYAQLAAGLVFVTLAMMFLFGMIQTDWSWPRLRDFGAFSSIEPLSADNAPETRTMPASTGEPTADPRRQGGLEQSSKLASFGGEQLVNQGRDSVGSTELDSDARTAYTRLYQLWGLEYQSRDIPSDCNYAVSYGLRCYFGRGTLQTLQSLNRPAVLTLRGASSGDNAEVLLISLNDEGALVYVRGSERELPLDELARAWTGQYLLLWRAPGSYTRVVKPGDRGAVVAWINQRLSPEISGAENVFDAAMGERVRLLQQLYGLVPDGEVGPLTMIALNNFSGAAAPRLREISAATSTAASE